MQRILISAESNLRIADVESVRFCNYLTWLSVKWINWIHWSNVLKVQKVLMPAVNSFTFINLKNMKSNNYQSTEINEKCQSITFDANGKILGSCDTLFTTARLTATQIKRDYPFLWKVLSYLKSNNNENDPLFFPQIDFECNGYRSICDFTFMKSEDALGIKRFICMIYDNSIHYKELIRNEYRSKVNKPNVQF